MDTAVGFSGFVRSFRLYLQVEGLRPQTVKNYCFAVEALGRHFPGQTPGSLSSTDLREYIHGLTATRTAKTVREIQLALRRFFRFLVAEREIGPDPMQGMKLMNFRVSPQPTYSEAEVKKLLLVCDPMTREGIRDAAIVTVLFDS